MKTDLLQQYSNSISLPPSINLSLSPSLHLSLSSLSPSHPLSLSPSHPLPLSLSPSLPLSLSPSPPLPLSLSPSLPLSLSLNRRDVCVVQEILLWLQEATRSHARVSFAAVTNRWQSTLAVTVGFQYLYKRTASDSQGENGLNNPICEHG